MTSPAPSRRKLFARGTRAEAARIADILRKETVGGLLLVAAAAIALIWANSPFAAGYFALRDFTIGPADWNLDLSLGQWASDGLLAIFFFLVGLELKREFVAGDLRRPATAIVPVAAAFGGVVVPALIYATFTASDPDALRGWAIPTATDIAFAVAVLAIIGSHLPSPLRIFLLTLAVVDDLIAIAIIAIFYTNEVRWLPLVLSVIPIALFAFLARRYRAFFARHAVAAAGILLPLGVVAWAVFHTSGIHATVAGVLLGFAVPVVRATVSGAARDGGVADETARLDEVLEHRLRPVSAGFAVPVFAFFAAGVTIGGDGFLSALTAPVTVGIVLALVLGKPIGIMGTTWLLTRLTRAELDKEVRWLDLLGVALLAGIGFTVSLLVADLSFGASANHDHAKVGILFASVIAALLATAVLRPRNRRYRRLHEEGSA